jgi:predicted naringenin-chalcone synthase
MFDKIKEGLVSQSAAKALELLRDFNDAIPEIKALGLSVENVGIKVGVPPEISARLVGSIAALDADELGKMSKESMENKLLAAILEALRTAASVKDHLQQLGFKGLSADVRLGLLPSVEVSLLN